MEVVLSVPFSYNISDEVRRLLEDFRDMVNFCIDYALKNQITSYAKLRKDIYGEWKNRWDYSTHYCHSACKIALAILKNWRRRMKKGGVRCEKPVARKLFMQLDPQLYKFYGDRIRISVKPRQFLFIDLKFGEYQRRFIEAWMRGELKTGEITINESKIVVPFKKYVDLSNPSDWIAIDVNESNVTGVSTNPHLLRIDTNMREIKSVYFEKRRRIQRLSKHRPLTAMRLLKKYSKRERNRVKDLCHKVSKRIVEFVVKYNFGIIMENLKGIRKSIHYNRILNRRLHSWNFRMLQFYIEYKAKFNGLPVEYVNPKHTSSLCPICGGKLAPNGHRLLRCDACGYKADRDIIAAVNLLRRNPRCGESPLPPKALNESLIEVRGKG